MKEQLRKSVGGSLWYNPSNLSNPPPILTPLRLVSMTNADSEPSQSHTYPSSIPACRHSQYF